MSDLARHSCRAFSLGAGRVRTELRFEEMPSWLNVGVKGSASWPATETTVEFCAHKLLL